MRTDLELPRAVFLLIACSLLAVAGCSREEESGPLDTPAPSSEPAVATAVDSPVTVARLLQVGEHVFPEARAGVFSVCGLEGNFERCPYTDRLKARLSELNATLCRCQNPSQTRSMTAEVADFGGVLYVALFNGSQSYMLKIVKEGGRLLVDDQACIAGGAETSIYVTANPCR
jgi:hypothetical protein